MIGAVILLGKIMIIKNIFVSALLLVVVGCSESSVEDKITDSDIEQPKTVLDESSESNSNIEVGKDYH